MDVVLLLYLSYNRYFSFWQKTSLFPILYKKHTRHCIRIKLLFKIYLIKKVLATTFAMLKEYFAPLC